MREQEFALAVDSCMESPKTLAGSDGPSWQQGRDPDELRMKLPLQIAGEQSGAFLMIVAYPEYHSLKFRIGIEFHGKVVDRLDYELDVAHANKAGFGDLVKGPHWHTWEDNRHLVGSIYKHDKLPIAISFTDAQRFDAALRSYCKKRNIEIGHHGIEFPLRRKLL
ncbi:MAG: hypothetical protein U1F39_07075 [Steroidobacteraceae bacterium]